MFGVLLASMLAAPAPLKLPEPVREISAPLGYFGNVVEDMPAGGMVGADRPVVPEFEGCARLVVYLMRMLGGTARTVEQLQQWLDLTAGFEPKFFKKKGTLAEVTKLLADAKFEPKKACGPGAVKPQFPLEVAGAPTKFCDNEGAKQGEFWFFNKGRPAALLEVLPGDPERCKVRISAVLFDGRGVARVRLHVDWGASASVSLVGDGCQVVDFTLNSATQSFVPTLKSCKR